jgi:hypothetical protein
MAIKKITAVSLVILLGSFSSAGFTKANFDPSQQTIVDEGALSPADTQSDNLSPDFEWFTQDLQASSETSLATVNFDEIYRDIAEEALVLSQPFLQN